MGIEEFIDVTPWEGLRIGTLRPPPHSLLRRISVVNRHWDVSLSPESTRVMVDGNELLVSDGPVVLRNVQLENGSFSAATFSSRALTMNIRLGTPHLRLQLDDAVSVLPADRVQIPAGRHRLTATAAKESG